MGPAAALRALAEAIEGRPDLTETEARRLVRDLERVALRVRRGDYEKSPFEDNVLNLPDRTHQVTVEAEFMASVGRSWARMLGPFGLGQARRVIDLGPGWAPKVELALLYAGFSGHAVMVNQDASAVATLLRFLSLFPLSFSVECVAEDLLCWAGPPGDFVLGNHLLDDLVIDLYCRQSGADAAALYAREAAFQQAWTSILAWPDDLTSALVARLADAVARLTLPGGVAAFVQYPSYAERTLSLSGAVAHGRRMLAGLGAALRARGFEDRSALAAAALGPEPGPFAPEHCLVLGRP